MNQKAKPTAGKNWKPIPHTATPWRIDGYDLWQANNPGSGYTGITVFERTRTPLAMRNLEFIRDTVNRHEKTVQKCKSLGYDGQKAIEKLPELIKTLNAAPVIRVDETLDQFRERYSEWFRSKVTLLNWL